MKNFTHNPTKSAVVWDFPVAYQLPISESERFSAELLWDFNPDEPFSVDCFYGNLRRVLFHFDCQRREMSHYFYIEFLGKKGKITFNKKFQLDYLIWQFMLYFEAICTISSQLRRTENWNSYLKSKNQVSKVWQFYASSMVHNIRNMVS